MRRIAGNPWGGKHYRSSARKRAELRVDYLEETEKAMLDPNHDTARRDALLSIFSGSKNCTSEMGNSKMIREQLIAGTWTGEMRGATAWPSQAPPPPSGPPSGAPSPLSPAGEAQGFDIHSEADSHLAHSQI